MTNELTIIIVNWNTRQLTLECLDSIYENKCSEDWNIVLVDNNSWDGSVEAINNKYPKVEVKNNKINVGFAGANNQILSRNDSEFYLLLNSDTRVLDDVIQRSIVYMRSKPEVGAMGCRVLNQDTSLQYTCSRFPTIASKLGQLFQLSKLQTGKYKSAELMSDWQRDTEREVDVISGCYLLVRNDVIKDVGLMDEEFFFFGEETDWCYRIKKCGWKLAFAPVGEIIHLGGGSSNSLNYQRDLMLTNSLVRFIRKHHGSLHAVTMYLLLFLFAVSRFTYWKIKGLFLQNDEASARAGMFWECIINYSKAWPASSNNLRW